MSAGGTDYNNKMGTGELIKAIITTEPGYI